MFLPIYFNLCSTLQLSVLCNRVQVGGVKDRQGNSFVQLCGMATGFRDAQPGYSEGRRGARSEGFHRQRNKEMRGEGQGGITSTLHILQLSCPYVLMSTAVMRIHSSPRYLPHQLSFKIQLDTYLRPETILTSNQFLGRLEIV